MLVLRRAPGMGWMLPLAPGELRAVFAVMQEATGLAGCTVELDLVGDEEIARLNAAHLGCTGPTNILSFPAEDGAPVPSVLPENGAPVPSVLPENGGPEDRDDAAEAWPDARPGDGPDEGGPCHLGWLVLSLDTWRRECQLYGQEPVEHALRLLAHGLGHLAGYDHGPEMDAFTDAAQDAGLAVAAARD
ncbi:rRNA maturation RNase YbeY [Nitratidesulfovibrio termitidis]|uniref:rRNA maturation RNase YbeY n=1 Tax=Nitratidesulfovibrio termitidis TaxID=42252 RepID=UPI000428699B|nr:rRNA maturation RNase YbeY [Nitratidesulfovibrio termitidis]